MKEYIKISFVMVAALSIVACGSRPIAKKRPYTPAVVVNDNGVPNMYQVQQGDSVSKIAARYGLHWRDVAKLNNLDQSTRYTIYTGQWIKLWHDPTQVVSIPPTQRVVSYHGVQTPVSPIVITPQPTIMQTVSTSEMRFQQNTPSVKKPPISASKQPTSEAIIRRYEFISPTIGRVMRYFNGGQNIGIWIAGNPNETVIATKEGQVLSTGKVDEKSSFVIIQHSQGLLSEYRFVTHVKVAANQFVKQGQPIATLGASNNSFGAALLEFRLSKDSVYFDPLPVLNQ